jgi:hypothetical protein
MKPNSIPSAGTKAEQITDVEDTNVNPFFSKPNVIRRFFEQMASKHNVKIDRLNIHITDGTLYVQEYDDGRYETFKLLECHDLKDQNYTDAFIAWRDKFFDYEIKVLEYKSKSKGNIYSTQELEKMYSKAMLESPHNGD